MELRWDLAKTQREIGELQRQLQTIVQDQERLRANLKELPQGSPIAKRIVQKFEDQETQIEKYQADIKRLQGQEHSQRKALDDFLANFSAD
jgi:septal ring factor EnvC (AmiA/AmiB activator)